jgi:hypothetical protein
MAKTYEALVLDDGRLSLTEDVRHEMALQGGERVKVTISRFPVSTDLDADNPLVELIGLCDSVERTDMSVNHDHYLYRKDTP